MTPMTERTEKQAERRGNKIGTLLLLIYRFGVRNKLVVGATHVSACSMILV
jgi:hypothetical protein